MSELTDMLVDSAERLFTDLCTTVTYAAVQGGEWPQALWAAATDAGLTSAVNPEEDTRQLLPPDVLAALLRTTGSNAVPLPVAETLLAQAALVACGLPIPEGPLSIAPALRSDRLVLTRRGSDWSLSGHAHGVGWGRHAQAIVAVAEYEGGHATVCIRGARPVRQRTNYAGEPHDDFAWDDGPIDAASVGAPGAGLARNALYRQAALWRCAQMVGAMQAVLEQTLRYTGERVQFGRPIAKFQAVQQQVASMAGQVAASAAALEAAVAAVAATAPGQSAAFEIAAAKLRVSEAAGHVVAVAHQCHGAMGFTREHPLHRNTLRLMAWRDEFGSEAEWAAWIGKRVATIGGEQLWAMVTDPQSFEATLAPDA